MLVKHMLVRHAWGNLTERRDHEGRHDRDGQGVIEYGLILALVTLLAIATLNTPSAKMNEILMRTANSLTSVS